MYFDPTPKTKQEDLFGRSFLFSNLSSYLQQEDVRLIVLKGLRRTGKTSLLNVALASLQQKNIQKTIFIDVRESPTYGYKDFLRFLLERIKTELGESLFQKIIKHILGIQLSYKELSATFFLETDKNFLPFLKKLNQELEQKKQFLILAFDEVQLLEPLKLNNLFAAIYDNYRQIKLIMTGSEIGLLDEFLGKKDANSPLFGRALLELEVPKLNSEEMQLFLQQGFQQIKKTISLEEIREVINYFDGIIGWATQYGWFRSKSFSHEEAIFKVIEEGTKLVKKELETFLAKRNKIKYFKVLLWVGKGHNQWSLLKNQFLREKLTVSDHQLQLYLKELMEYGFLSKEKESYYLTEPLLLRSLI